MTSIARSAGETGALFDVSGVVSDFATWSEDIYFIEGGAGVDLTGLSFQFQFRSDPTQTSADFTLSTTDGTLTLVADDDGVSSIVRVAVTAGDLGAYVGDYIADLVAQDVASKITHYAHGIITFRNNPVAWS